MKSKAHAQCIFLMLTVFIGIMVTATPVFSAGDERLSVWIKNLESDKVLIRKNAIFYLGWVRDPRALPHLYEVIEQTPEDELKIEAVEALLRIPRKKSLDFLKGQLGKGHAPAVLRKMRHAIEIFETLVLKKKLP